ncbi:sensor histidine kinase [Desulfovibrio ferrophilus]|uniref:histidine kinase n=1 Tax=Desulfovibrio ferrophilus TaxID=241368 RepID=A0A2Z6AVU7_9BACT|nr:sensor histidine kinase [Desulfovibrio ferrophilus]BBD07372.1 integral membrane sensor signal transduction histidine kinase [Desulfovibrio ferrophilus]
MRDFILPRFWRGSSDSNRFKGLFNYKTAWLLAIVLTAFSSLAPLLAMVSFDYQISRSAAESEVRLRTSRTVSNAKRVLSFYLQERISALQFVLRDNTYGSLSDNARLQLLLEDLTQSHGGFIDLGIIDQDGRQKTYVGPYNLQGKNYKGQDWFGLAASRGSYISGVFLGFRNVPHLVVVVRHDLPGGGFFLLRATLDTEQFSSLAGLELSSGGDSFIINHGGVLQTPSRYHGDVLSDFKLPVPTFSDHSEVIEENAAGGRVFIGYAYIPDSPFIFMVIKDRSGLLASWYETRVQLLGFLIASIIVVLLVVSAMATYLVNSIYIADQNRAAVLHHVEHSNKLASIGRLAAGVAHEVNNPLAVIGEKTGLLKDLLTYGGENVSQSRLLDLARDIEQSVERCGNITKHLLGFARHIHVSVENINLAEIIDETMSFLRKEAEYRSVEITTAVAEGQPDFKCDRGKLQQILLNLVNNAFQAVSEGGHVSVTADSPDDDHIRIQVSDDGCGISDVDRKRIFEPFFSTKTASGGTGLGLSITYGLVHKLSGDISIESTEGEGTIFTIVLPRDCGGGNEDTCEYC